jgi:hypothetical protein
MSTQPDYEQDIRLGLREAETELTAALESAKAWTAHRNALKRLVDKLDGTPVLRLKQAYDAGYKAGKNHESKVYNFKGNE